MAARASWRARLLAAAAASAASPECDFIAGKAGSNACPGGAIMATLSECHGEGAAGRGAGPVSVDSASEPAGCFVYGGVHYYNANPKGAPAEGSAPFCKRCPASGEAQPAAGAAGGNRSRGPAAQFEESFNTYTCGADCALWPGQLNTAEFRCFNGKCLPISSYCDGRRDCADGSDEMHCPSEGGGAPAKEGSRLDATFGTAKSSTPPPGEGETSTAPAEPYDCHADFADWETGWTEPRKEWCCKNYGGPCAASAPQGEVQIYDCALDLETWEQSWDPEKKEWCCSSEHVGCEPYECGENEDPAGLDAAEIAWCCLHLSKHCPELSEGEGGSEEPYDCAIGVLTWRSSWDDQKQEWCCEHHHLGCGKSGVANLSLTGQQPAATSEQRAPTTTASRTRSSEPPTSSRSSTSATTRTTSAALSSTFTMGASQTDVSESSNTTRASSTSSTTATVTSASARSARHPTTTSTQKAEEKSRRPAQHPTSKNKTSATAFKTTARPSQTSAQNSSISTHAGSTAGPTSTGPRASTGNASVATTTRTKKAEEKSSKSAKQPATRSTTSVTHSRTSLVTSSSSSVTESTVTRTGTTASTTTTDTNTTVSIISTTASPTSETSSQTTISTQTAVATATSTRHTRPPPASMADATGLGADISKAEAVSAANKTSTTKATTTTGAPTSTRATTSTTFQPTSTQSTSGSTEPACSKINSAYLPLDMVGHPLKRVANERECQQRCARVDGCAHYSYWRPARHCHLQGARSRRFGDALFSSGPPECPAPRDLVGKASVGAAGGADSPLLRGSPRATAGGAAASALAALSLACVAGVALRGARGRALSSGQGGQELLLADGVGVRSGRASPGPGDRAARWAGDLSVDRAYGELPLVAPEEHRVT
ncbi:unnamed protein product [Prorocentrum cordatum]|uniref:Apple domain-containing protein n=1 Tax=Prorocentrum cordatum TaxID=2364126 RepID=A0ABN9T8C6_9DINO|nr:unnamed protein product [Polarella glacialis]